MGSFGSAVAFSAALAGWASIVAACGGAMSVGGSDAGSMDTGSSAEDAASADWEGDDGHSTPCHGPVTFHMRASESSTSSYCLGSACLGGVWLDMTTEHGEKVHYAPSCEVGGCNPICLHPRRMKPEGELHPWDGKVWVSTCGNTQPCAPTTCATAGKYVATMCAYANTITDAGLCNASPMSPPTCVEIAFEYPTTATVEGVLP
jgi:hypothetical protein